MAAAATYTTYLRTELDPQTRQSYSALQNIARDTYRQIGVYAEQAGLQTAGALADPRAARALTGLGTQAGTVFGSIRREATATATAISIAQAKLSGFRASSAAVGGGSTGASAQAGAAIRATAANDNFTKSNARAQESATRAGRNFLVQSQATRRLDADTSRLSRSMDVLGTTLAVVQGPLGPIAGRIGAVSSAINTLGTGTLLLAGAATALVAFAAVANTYVEVESRLRPLYDTQTQVNQAIQETGRIAINTRGQLSSTADLYAKLTSAGRDYNLTQRQIARTTELASKAATISGGNAASRDAGLYQFSQGLSSGKLGGDELRSVLENIPELARAIAAGFKNADGSIGTTIGNLRKLGAEGSLATGAIVDALGRSGTDLDVKFSKLPLTISSAKNELVTTFTLMAGGINNTIGVTSTLAQGIKAVTANLDILLATAGALAARFVLPQLGGLISQLGIATLKRREFNREFAVAVANQTVTPLTPQGVNRAKAITGVNEAAAARNLAAANVAAQKSVIAAIDEEIATTTAAKAALQEKGRAAQATSAFEVAAAEQRVAILRAELAQIVENRAALSAQVVSYDRAAALLAKNPSNNPKGVQDRFIAANDAAATEARLALAKANVQAQVTSGALADATIALSAAQDVNTVSTNANTTAQANAQKTGFALLAVHEARIIAEQALIAADAELVVAETGVAVATARMTAAQSAYAIATGVATQATLALAAAGRGILAFFGGPLVLALTVVAGAMVYLASQSNDALDALKGFSGGQEELQKRLGITTGKLNEQSEAARGLALALAQTEQQKSRAKVQGAKDDLAGSLQAVAGNAVFGTRVLSGENRKIANTLKTMIDGLREGKTVSSQGTAFITNLQRTQPELFKSGGIRGAALSLLGKRPEDTVNKLLGVEAARINVQDANTRAQEVTAELAKPRVKPKPTVPLTLKQLTEQSSQLATNAELIDPTKAAVRKRDEGLAAILKNKDLNDAEKLEKATDVQAVYQREIQAIGRRNAALENRNGRAATAAQNALLNDQVAAAEAAARGAEKLADIRARYDQAPKLVDQARDDVRSLDKIEVADTKDAKGNVTGTRGLTDNEKLTETKRIAEGLRQPFADVTREYERQSTVQDLLLNGREAEAAALDKAYAIIDKVGFLERGQYEQLVQSAQKQLDLNRAIEDRGRITNALRGSVDEVKGAVEAFLNELPNDAVAASANLGKSLLAGFRATSAKILTEELFGGVQQRIDDLISGKTALVNATEFTAGQATRTGGIIQQFGDVVQAVLGKLEAGNAGVVPGSAGAGGVPAAIAGKILPEGQSLLTKISAADNVIGRSTSSTAGKLDQVGDASTALADVVTTASSKIAAAAQGLTDGAIGGADAGDSITVVAKKAAAVLDTAKDQSADSTIELAKQNILPKLGVSKPLTVRETYNEIGSAVGSKIDKALGTNFAKTVGGKLGDTLQNVGKGTAASGLFGAVTGAKQSQTGAAIGGALGGQLGGLLGPLGKTLGPIVGGIIGGTLGSLFRKVTSSNASISLNQYGEVSGGQGTGNDATATKQATGVAASVASGVQQIADQLGATITNLPALTLGTFDGKYRVATTNTTKSLNYNNFGPGTLQNFDDDQGAAIEFAIRYSVGNAVVSGISAASQRILKSGQDLQRAIEKALLIESIPKRLLAIQDPVRSAVNDLNTEFGKIIQALNEGQATAEQYAQAQTLYDIERAKAISAAQKAATSAIQQYLTDITAGNASPLNKATVYDNAKGNFDKLNRDVQAGKTVDPDDLVQAGKNFQDASRALNGSNQSFFQDFDLLQAVLKKAIGNTGVIDSANSGTLPDSPFASKAVQDAISGGTSAQVGAINSQTATLDARLAQIQAALGGGGGGGGGAGGLSSVKMLPGFVEYQ